jgi:2-methylcitrate dehydratase PrpD
MGGEIMGKEISTRLAEFITETQYPGIPEEVVIFTKQLAMKTIAGMVVGSSLLPSRKIANIVKNRNLNGDIGVIGCGFQTSLWEAIFLNAFFAHASELEDDAFGGSVSWDITVVPLLFSLAQYLRLSGKALLEALAIGLEVHVRTCMFRSEHLGLMLIPGAVGPAAGAARALGLGTEETASAIGLSMSNAPLSVINFGTDAHYFESALQSLQGIMAAEMAKEGMSSNPNLSTYLSNYLGKNEVIPERIVEGLGKKWMLHNIWVKKYPCCFLNHRQIDIVLGIRKQHHISYGEVEKIIVHASPGDEPCNRPDLKTVGDLQFSFYHILGAAMLDGDVNFTHINTDILADPKYKEARSKVEVIVHPELSSGVMAAPARVIIKTKDGREFSEERIYPIGSSQEPLTMDQFKKLYIKFTQGVLSEKQIEKTLNSISQLEQLNDIGELMDILTWRYEVAD